MKRFLNPLRNNRGSVYVDLLVSVFAIMLCISFSLALLPVFTQAAKLQKAADTLMSLAEFSGTTDLDTAIAQLESDYDLTLTVDWSGTEYITGTEKVQLDHTISMKMSTVYTLSFYNFASSDIDLDVKHTGASEVYFK